MARIRDTDRIMGVMAHTDAVMRRTAHTDPVMAVTLAMPTQAPSRSRLVIGPIIIAARVTMWAGPITSGGRDIGCGATGKESGFTAATL